MPDLDINVACYCSSNEFWTTRVKGSKNNEYLVTWTQRQGDNPFVPYDYDCTCPDYFHRQRHCKHILQIIKDQTRCAWNQNLEPALKPSVTKNGDICCPKCQGSVGFARVAV